MNACMACSQSFLRPAGSRVYSDLGSDKREEARCPGSSASKQRNKHTICEVQMRKTSPLGRECIVYQILNDACTVISRYYIYICCLYAKLNSNYVYIFMCKFVLCFPIFFPYISLLDYSFFTCYSWSPNRTPHAAPRRRQDGSRFVARWEEADHWRWGQDPRVMRWACLLIKGTIRIGCVSSKVREVLVCENYDVRVMTPVLFPLHWALRGFNRMPQFLVFFPQPQRVDAS